MLTIKIFYDIIKKLRGWANVVIKTKTDIPVLIASKITVEDLIKSKKRVNIYHRDFRSKNIAIYKDAIITQFHLSSDIKYSWLIVKLDKFFHTIFFDNIKKINVILDINEEKKAAQNYKQKQIDNFLLCLLKGGR